MFVVHFFFLLTSFSQPASLTVSDDFSAHHLQQEVEVLRIDTNIDANEAKTRYAKGQFAEASKGLIYPAGAVYYWAHFSLSNTSALPKRVVIEVRNGHLNHLELFHYSSSLALSPLSTQTGDYTAFDTRPIKNRFFVFSIELQAHESRSFLLHTDKFNESIKFPVSVYSEEHFYQAQSVEYAVLGIYFGIYAFIILIFMITALFNRTIINISLLIYTFNFALFVIATSGMGYQYLWPESPFWQSISRSFTGAFASIALLVFTYHFFQLGQIANKTIVRTHQLLISIMVLNWLLLLNYYILIWLESDLQYWFAIDLLQSILFVQFIYLIALPLYQAFADYKLKYLLFLVGTSGVIVSSSAFIFEELGFYLSTFLQEQLLLLALVLDFSVLVFIVGYEFYTIRIQNHSLAYSLSKAVADGAKRFLHGQHTERNRLAQQIHDGAGVKLAVLQMQIAALTTAEQDKQKGLVEATKSIAADMRNYSHNLSSEVLEKLGLVEAISEFIHSFNAANCAKQIALSHSGEYITDKTIERELYFMCLELLNNAHKHSSGTDIHVVLLQRKNCWTLTVSDDGGGYGESILTHKGLGLQGIYWRLAILQGDLAVYYKDQRQYHKITIPLAVCEAA